jgi:dTDP-4-dehydrorhamnose 3,5-epimerase
MQVTPSALPEVLILDPQVYGDERGFFFESFNKRAFTEQTGVTAEFVQDNHSRSARNVLRGLHFQIHRPQGKLVRVVAGAVFDVAVDIRRSSANFGKSFGLALSAENKRMLWIPCGFAHGFLVLSDYAEFVYKTTDYWYPEHERCIIWNDPDLAIDWHTTAEPVLSVKDSSGLRFRDAEVYP